MTSSIHDRFSNLLLLIRTGLAMILAAQASATYAADNTDSAPKLEPVLTIAPLQPLAEHPRTSVNVVEQLRRNHYLSKPIDDALSSAMLDKYLNILDGSKSYFLASDIQDFEPLRYRLDDALKDSDLDPAFHIFNRYQDRLLDRLNFSLELLGQGLEPFDFTLDETIETDREQARWPADKEALDDLWRRRL